MKPHRRMGKLAKKRRQERAQKRNSVKSAGENLRENSVLISYEEAYQATQGFRYSQNELFRQIEKELIYG